MLVVETVNMVKVTPLEALVLPTPPVVPMLLGPLRTLADSLVAMVGVLQQASPLASRHHRQRRHAPLPALPPDGRMSACAAFRGLLCGACGSA